MLGRPSTIEELDADSLLITTRHSLLRGAFGSIDGLALPVQESDDPEIENVTYNGPIVYVYEFYLILGMR